jgi:hypothetical protein
VSQYLAGGKKQQTTAARLASTATSHPPIEKAEYCHSNPVKRRLVKSAQDWRWSSFQWLVLGKHANEPLPVDGWDETLLSAPESN